MSNEINEKIFKSVDTIVSARLQGLEFDKTIVGKIESTPESRESTQKYSVNYKGASITAYVNEKDKEYYIDDEVYVLVPQGDFTQKKIITGQVISDYKQAVDNKSKRFIAVREISSFKDKDEDHALALQKDISTYNNIYNSSNLKYVGYTYLRIELMFQAILENVVSGEYGFKIVLTGYDQAARDYNPNVSTKIEKTYTQKDIDAMNKYNTGLFSTQEFLIKIKDFVVTGISIQMYQNGNFYFNNGNQVEFNDDLGIRVRDFKLQVGYRNEDFNDAQSTNSDYAVYLYTENGIYYSSSDTARTIKYRLLNRKAESIANVDITGVVGATALTLGYLDSSATASSGILGSGWRVQEYTKGATLNLDSGIQNKELTYRLGIDNFVYLGDHIQNTYVSNNLIFNNKSYVLGSGLLDQLTGLQITPNDNNNIFYVYGQDNQLLNASDGERIHKLAVSFSSGDTSKQSSLKVNDIIYYTIPKEKTMLLPASMKNLDDSNPDGSVYRFKIQLKAEDLNQAPGTFFIPFKIASLYSPQYKNNTIDIKVEMGDGNIYTGSQEFLFGTSGSSGANYVLRLYLTDAAGNEVKVIDPDKVGNSSVVSYYIKAELYNYAWEPIKENINIVYQWKHASQELYYFDKTDETDYSKAELHCYGTTGGSKNKSDLAKLIVVGTCVYKNNTLKGYLAIPSLLNTTGKNYTCIDGCSIITYDITGKKPFYAKQAYKLYYLDTTSNDTLVENNVTWKMYNGDNTRVGDNLLRFEDNIITPPAVYSNQQGYPYVLGQVNDQDTWLQPILMVDNSYPIAMWNDLNSNIIFEGKGTLTSTMVGQLNNTQEKGVVMGTFENEATASSEFGLYAFNGKNNIIFQINNQGRAEIESAYQLVDKNDTRNIITYERVNSLIKTVDDLQKTVNSLTTTVSNLRADINRLQNQT